MKSSSFPLHEIIEAQFYLYYIVHRKNINILKIRNEMVSKWVKKKKNNFQWTPTIAIALPFTANYNTERPFKIKWIQERKKKKKTHRYPAKVSASFSACVFYSVLVYDCLCGYKCQKEKRSTATRTISNEATMV